jgi:hypothetical protein
MFVVAALAAVAASHLSLGESALAAELLAEDGVWVKGPPRMTGGRVTVGDRTVSVDRIVSHRFQGTMAETIDKGMALRNGDVLVGAVRGLQADRADFLSDTFGPVSPKAESVLALSFKPRSVLDLTGSGTGTSGAELSNGDFVRGDVLWVNEETVGVNNGRRVVRVPRSRTTLLRLGAGADENVGDNEVTSKQIVRLANGDRLSGRLKRIDSDALVFDTAFAKAVRLPVTMVVELWSEGAAIVPVSTLSPVEVRQTPHFDESFPHRLDRNLAGAFLSVGGRRFERGLGCHSLCELEYDLSRRYATFLAEVGVDDSVGTRGEVVFRVLVDGKTAFDSGPVRGGEPPRTVSVELSGRSRMRLVVDFGHDGSAAGDHADWGRAVLLRKQ